MMLEDPSARHVPSLRVAASAGRTSWGRTVGSESGCSSRKLMLQHSSFETAHKSLAILSCEVLDLLINQLINCISY